MATSDSVGRATQSRPKDCRVCDSEQDAVALAQAAVRAGLIGHEVLNHLASLHPQVPNSMKHRYLVAQLYDKVKNDRDYFARVVEVLSQFEPQPKAAQSASDTPLGAEHVSDLTELLAGYKYKWNLIGTSKVPISRLKEHSS